MNPEKRRSSSKCNFHNDFVFPSIFLFFSNLDALSQLIQCFQRSATSEESQAISIADDQLYVNYANVMARSIHIDDDDDAGGDEGEVDQAQKEEIAQVRGGIDSVFRIFFG